MQNAARIEKPRWSPGSPVIRRRILLTRTTFCTGRQRAGNGEARQHAFLVIQAIPQRLKELTLLGRASLRERGPGLRLRMSRLEMPGWPGWSWRPVSPREKTWSGRLVSERWRTVTWRVPERAGTGSVSQRGTLSLLG